MNIDSQHYFPTNLEQLTLLKFGAFVYDDGESLVECGLLRKLYESIKGILFGGAFGIQNRTSSCIIGDRLVTILKQSKHTITQNQLKTIRQVAERTKALTNVGSEKDHASLRKKLDKRFAKLAQPAIAAPEAPRSSIVALQDQEQLKNANNAQNNKEQDLFENLATVAEELRSLTERSGIEKIPLPEIVTTTEIPQADAPISGSEIQELPLLPVPKKPVQTWSQVAIKIAMVAVPTVLAVAGIALARNSFSNESPDFANTCPATPLMTTAGPAIPVSTTISGNHNYENITPFIKEESETITHLQKLYDNLAILKKVNEKLEKENFQLKEKSDLCKEEAEHLKGTIAPLEEHSQALTIQNAEITERNGELIEKVNALTKHQKAIKSLEEYSQTLTIQYAKIIERNDGLSEKVNALLEQQKTIKSLEEYSQILTNQNAEIMKQNDQLTEKVNDLTGQRRTIELLEEHSQSLALQNAQIIKQNDELIKKVDASEGLIDEIKATRESVETIRASFLPSFFKQLASSISIIRLPLCGAVITYARRTENSILNQPMLEGIKLTFERTFLPSFLRNRF